MGSGSSSLTEDILDEYTTLTYLSKNEILSLFKAVTNIGSPQDFHYRYSPLLVEELFPQLKCNPFSDRIYRVFSTYKDGKLSFEDILDLCSVMSEKCPEKVKAAWAFRIFDFDEDDAIGEEDLMMVIDRLSSNEKNCLQQEEKRHIAQLLLQEMALESNGRIGHLEFEHAITKMSEFSSSFCFRF